MNILLGVTGGIAAYKSAELIRLLKQQGACVRVVMTQAANAFITPLTLQALSGEPVYEAFLDERAEEAMGHIALARWADRIVVAPASADFIARLAYGHANDLLTTLCLATTAPIMVVPAMNRVMWENAATQANMVLLQQRGIESLGPDTGPQACGETGFGRMIEPSAITQALKLPSSTRKAILEGKRILITAGPTQEPIDPVRYITNKSSGKMGYALAEAALAAGAQVTLISGPVAQVPAPAVNCIRVETAKAMLEKVMEHVNQADIFIAAAAVADYCVPDIAEHKIKKSSNTLDLHLVKNPDILASVAVLPHPPFLVGFAAETQNMVDNARAKLLSKRVEVIFANDVSRSETGFDSKDNEVTAVWKDGEKHFNVMPKKALANQLMQFIAEKYYEKNPT
jgi:phosphopantothenoylcysteine decarboxylase/phosphopantothenate--cysteine ligase